MKMSLIMGYGESKPCLLDAFYNPLLKVERCVDFFFQIDYEAK